MVYKLDDFAYIKCRSKKDEYAIIKSIFQKDSMPYIKVNWLYKASDLPQSYQSEEFDFFSAQELFFSEHF